MLHISRDKLQYWLDFLVVILAIAQHHPILVSL